jgi:hypothetical protein
MDELMKKAKKEYEAANAGTTIELVPIVTRCGVGADLERVFVDHVRCGVG